MQCMTEREDVEFDIHMLNFWKPGSHSSGRYSPGNTVRGLPGLNQADNNEIVHHLPTQQLHEIVKHFTVVVSLVGPVTRTVPPGCELPQIVLCV